MVIDNYCPNVVATHHIQIEEVCRDAKLAHDLGVPGKLTNYVAYIDLVLLRLASNTIQYNTIFQCIIQGEV